MVWWDTMKVGWLKQSMARIAIVFFSLPIRYLVLLKALTQYKHLMGFILFLFLF